MPNGAAMRFVPGSGIICNPLSCPRLLRAAAVSVRRGISPGRAALGGADFMVLRALRFERIMATA
jgi:hypothetical protein